MKKLMHLFTVLFFLSLSATSYAQATNSAEHLINQEVAEFMHANNVPGVAIELYVNGKPYSYYYGYANPEKKIPVTKKTIFELGSITKLMTSLLLTQEVDYNKIQLSDPVTNYLPNLGEDFKEVKVQDLATHVSGLPFKAPANIANRDELNKYLTTWSPDESPRYEWRYSNFGMGMLGFVLETETNKNYDQLYRRHILQPLHMQEIGLIVPKKQLPNYAQGFNSAGKPVSEEQLGLFPSAAGMKASAEDMQKFLGAAIGVSGTPERIFYPMRMTQVNYVRLSNNKMQGLGWEIYPFASFSANSLKTAPEDANFGPIKVEEVYVQPKFDGDALMDKTGATEGFRSYIAVIPNKQTGITVLANRYVSNKAIVELGRRILFKLNGMG